MPFQRMSREPGPQLPGAVAGDAPLRSAPPAALLQALISFENAPGRYATVLREPRLVFDHPLVVLQLAAGRELPAFAEQAHLVVAARRAARYFMRVVMLRPGADHFALLGLTPSFEPATLREHYRLMIRLVHPDFTSTHGTWPADAAARINFANDVLGSAVKRRLYTEQWAAAQAATAAIPGGSVAVGTPAARPKPRKLPPSKVAGALRPDTAVGGSWVAAPHNLGMTLGGATLIVVLFLWFNGTANDNGSLRAREPGAQGRGLGADVRSVLDLDLDLGSVAEQSTPEAALPAAILADERGHSPAQASKPGPQAVRQTGGQLLPELSREVSAQVVVLPVASHAVLVQADTPHVPAVALKWSPSAADESVANTRVPEFAIKRVEPPEPVPVENPTKVESRATTGLRPLKISDAQPTLSGLLDAIQSGRADRVLGWVDPAWRNAAHEAQFVQVFNQVVAGQAVSALEKVHFSGHNDQLNLIVNGELELKFQDVSSQTQQRGLQIRAYFLHRDGRAVLTRLVASKSSP